MSEVVPMTTYTILWRVEGTYYKGETTAVSEKAAIRNMSDRISKRLASSGVRHFKFSAAIKGTPIINPNRESPEWRSAVTV